jgi:hypothetical protein
MKTSELTHDALVAAVAMCEGYTDLHKIEGRMPHEPQFAMWPPRREYGVMELWEIGSDCDWGWFGPIIQREKISIEYMAGAGDAGADVWVATRIEHPAFSEEQGPTALVAAMRCYVASKLGDNIELPEELK